MSSQKNGLWKWSIDKSRNSTCLVCLNMRKKKMFWGLFITSLNPGLNFLLWSVCSCCLLLLILILRGLSWIFPSSKLLLREGPMHRLSDAVSALRVLVSVLNMCSVTQAQSFDSNVFSPISVFQIHGLSTVPAPTWLRGNARLFCYSFPRDKLKETQSVLGHLTKPTKKWIQLLRFLLPWVISLE